MSWLERSERSEVKLPSKSCYPSAVLKTKQTAVLLHTNCINISKHSHTAYPEKKTRSSSCVYFGSPTGVSLYRIRIEVLAPNIETTRNHQNPQSWPCAWRSFCDLQKCKSNASSRLEARGGERKLAGLPVVCCWCCCCWCCCCSAGAGSSAAAAAAAAAAGAGWSAAAAAAAALGCRCCCRRWVVCCCCWCCCRCCRCCAGRCRCLVCCSCLVVALTARRGGVEPRGGGVHKIDLINYLRFLRCVHPSLNLLKQEQLQLAKASFRENKHVKDDYPDHAIDGSVFLRYLGSTESRGNTSPFRDLSWILQWMSITAGGLCQPN